MSRSLLAGVPCLALGLCVVVGCGGETTPRFTAPRTLGGVEISADVLNRGANVYAMRCSSCHGNDGSGDGPAGRALKERPRDFRLAEFRYKSTPADALPTDADLQKVVREGLVERGMPGWPGMNDQDIEAVAHYLKTFSPRWGPTDAPQTPGGN